MGRKVKRNPRIAVTLSPEANDLIGKVAKLTKASKASLVSEMVDLTLPALVQIGEALQSVKDAPMEAQRILARFAAEATRDVAQAQLDLDASIDARTVKGKRVRRAARVAES